MTDADLDKLAALAKAATPGLEWFADMDGLKLKAEPPGNHFIPAEVTLALCATGDHAYRVLSYLAAANPAVILDLIASARRDAEEIERLRAGLEEVVCWFGEAPHTFPDWKVTAEALADMAQNVLNGHPALSSPASRAAHTGEG